MVSSIPAFLKKPLEDYREVLRGVFGDRLRDIRLFGSHARGEADEESDIDILVLVDGLTVMEQWRGGALDVPIAVATGLPLASLLMATEDFEALRRGERLLARDIDAEGISL